MKNTPPAPDDYGEVIQRLEKQAEHHAPGVLELLETYGRTDATLTPWVPINTSAVSYSTSTNPRVHGV